MKIVVRTLALFVTAAALMTVQAPAELAAQQIYDVGQLTEKPQIASPMAAQRAIEKAYSSGPASRGVQGKVVLQFVVQASGKVDASSVTVQSTEHGDLASAAKQAISNIEFVPGRVEGTAVATRVVFPISFVAR